MKKLLLLIIITLLSAQYCFAESNIHKENIKKTIDNAYRVYPHSPYYAETLARGKADYYIKDEFGYKECEYKCIEKKQQMMQKANNFSVFTDTETIRKEANEYYDECINKCKTNLENSTQDYYNYINKYIELKNKSVHK